MGRTTDQIEDHIASERGDLKANLAELGDKVKAVTDWRQHFHAHPGAFVAAAIGTGFLLAALTRSGSRRSGAEGARAAAESASNVSAPGHSNKHQIYEGWDTVKRALIGVAAAKFKGVLGEVVPGFTEHLDIVEGDKARSSEQAETRTH